MAFFSNIYIFYIFANKNVKFQNYSALILSNQNKMEEK